MYEGLHTDEHNRQVFDGVMAHIAGAARIDLNARCPSDRSRRAQRDVISIRGLVPARSADRRAGRRARDARWPATRRKCSTPTRPSSTGARAASPASCTPRGRRRRPDAAENVRFYFIAGTQHGPARFRRGSPTDSKPDNAVDYWWTMRALLLAMHKWVKEGAAPPPSQYPRLMDGTLVQARAVAFRPFRVSRRRRHLTAVRAFPPLPPDPSRSAARIAAGDALLVPRWTKTQRACGHPSAGRRRAARNLHRMELRRPEIGRPRDRLAIGIVDPVSATRRAARAAPGIAPVDRGALRSRDDTVMRVEERPTRSSSAAT